ncbi:LOW QUALITY PROTEIN: NLR family CARD domain-containing protein 3-like [Xyrichtys novacula]|uniref:LOW QUALITY PROTEIN: NLR family CARD domain-containing protein 3-like n=1 Tax=Xyrichtys novacula TaxID=13765 RepID=A0AAV1EMZ3_XYRNO|nr:LOW QUALITY PROTEIN: NLR family CARD domain-containing protein 3-like [Xyrichtys novacula]
MDQCEDRKEADPPSKVTLDLESAQRLEKQHKPDPLEPRPDTECVSLKTTRSMTPPPDFKKMQQLRSADAPEPSLVSMKSDKSKPDALNFGNREVQQDNPEVPRDQCTLQQPADLDSVFMLLEDNIITFVKKELKRVQMVLSSDHQQRKSEEEEELEEEQMRVSREAFEKIVLHFLRRLKREDLADCLQSRECF